MGGRKVCRGPDKTVSRGEGSVPVNDRVTGQRSFNAAKCEIQYFGSDPALYRVRITDHKLERIVGLKGIRLTIGFAGTWCGLAPDDSSLLLRDVGSQEIYALDLQLP